MQRNVVVEISHLLRKDGAGIGRKRLLAGLGRIREVHEALGKGTEEGRWPHARLLEDEEVASARTIAEALRGRAPGLVVVGQPGAVAPLRAIVDALGTAQPRFVTSPDEAADLDGIDAGLLVLEGPTWVDRVAEWAVGQGRSVAVAGPGVHAAPPDGWWISDAVAGDGRFGGLGLAAAVCGAWAGVDVDSLVAGARDMREACGRSALFENPAYTLAVASAFVARDLGCGVGVHVVNSGRLAAFASWLGRLWGAVLSSAGVVEGVTRYTGGPGVPLVLGDEEQIEALFRGPRDKLVVSWEAAMPAGPFAEDVVAQARAFQDLLDREAIPNLRVRLPGLDARTLGAAMWLAAHAAVTAALFTDLDPLGLEAVGAWYGALERARADVDAGPASA